MYVYHIAVGMDVAPSSQAQNKLTYIAAGLTRKEAQYLIDITGPSYPENILRLV